MTVLLSDESRKSCVLWGQWIWGRLSVAGFLKTCSHVRKPFIALLALFFPSSLGALFAEETPSSTRDVIEGIETSVVRKNRDGKGTTWFHPRGCLLPTDQGAVALMTLQSIGGSDYFGPVHWSVSADQAKTWSDPQPIPSLGRNPLKDEIEEGVCDVVPEYHAKTGTVLAMGHNVYYSKGKLFRGDLSRWPVYAVRHADGTWSAKQKLVWDDPRGSLIYTANCAQRITLPDGDLLFPISFGSKEKPVRSVTTFLCGYDGVTVTVKKIGRELHGKAGRGFLEPSLAFLDGVYYMTIRAEDGKGHVATSKDGLTWSDPIPWAWQNGATLAMSSTQQHWLIHSDALYLVYTRKSDVNSKVFRWRIPLYLALVDRKTLRLIPETERVVFPINGGAYSGNFHPMFLNAHESLVTDGECFPANGYKGDQLQARIRWKTPNRLIE